MIKYLSKTIAIWPKKGTIFDRKNRHLWEQKPEKMAAQNQIKHLNNSGKINRNQCKY